ncbi:hypothetical protein F7725_025608 [Dissostichus mawsoni]|uniref:Uncharacterized protein n=1 Tax=Dissostichus mawsoni TaxID=36200 RepID=A0A7J5XBN6_DISMA|nr:hypothetical protein F7725_025608 [Dissostichus mawsoni]
MKSHDPTVSYRQGKLADRTRKDSQGGLQNHHPENRAAEQMISRINTTHMNRSPFHACTVYFCKRL